MSLVSGFGVRKNRRKRVELLIARQIYAVNIQSHPLCCDSHSPPNQKLA